MMDFPVQSIAHCLQQSYRLCSCPLLFGLLKGAPLPGDYLLLSDKQSTAGLACQTVARRL
jgi:hypothetical protein